MNKVNPEDPDLFSFYLSSNTTAASSLIGGWNFNNRAIYNGTEVTDDTEYATDGITIGINSSSEAFISAKNFRIEGDGSAYFKGALEAASGTFAGELSAVTGSFGAVDIDGTLAMGASGSISIDGGVIVIDNEGIRSTNEAFKLETDGTGKIGGFLFDTETLTAGTSSGNYLGMSPGAGTGDAISFWAGAVSNSDANISAAPFRVTNTGALTATNATITGEINAESGTIGSYTIDEYSINKNLISKASFESTSADYNGWVLSGTWTRSAVKSYAGNHSVSRVMNTTTSSLITYTFTKPKTSDVTLRFAYQFADVSSGSVGFYVQKNDGSPTSIIFGNSVPVNTWNIFTVTIPHSGTNINTIRIGTSSSTTPTPTLFIDEIELFDGSSASTDFINLSSAGLYLPNVSLDKFGIIANAGKIGGFTTGTTSLTAGTGGSSVGVTTDAVAFYAGNATPGSAPFRVTNTGALTATSGSIGGWTITGTDLQRAGSDDFGTSTLTIDGLKMMGWGGGFTTISGSYSRNSIVFENQNATSSTPEILSNGVSGTGNRGLNITTGTDLSLHSITTYVYASRLARSTAAAARITVGTGGVSTKIVKTNIQDINYNQLDNFLNLIQPKKFTNIMKNKEKVSLIIEDEEDRNIPFKDILFKREDKLYAFQTLPSYLLPYENDTEVIQKEYSEDGEVIIYYFSPKVLDEQTLHGLTLAAAKYNHTRIKDLEEENKKLKEEIALIKAKIGI